MLEICEEKADPKGFSKLPILDTNNPSKKHTEKEEKFLREIVEYEFMNLEDQGYPLTFSYGDAKNKVKITLLHSGKYHLPRFLARHIESKTCPIWKWRPNGAGQLNKVMDGRKSRFQMREVYS